MPVKHAFGLVPKTTWFLHAEASVLHTMMNGSGSLQCLAHVNEAEARQCQDLSPAVENKRSSDAISAIDMAQRCLSTINEVARSGNGSRSAIHCSSLQKARQEQLMVNMDKKYPDMLADLSPGTSMAEVGRIRVGERLIRVSNELGISSSKQSPLVSLCRLKEGISPGPGSSLVRSLVFEITDSDDG